MPYLKAVLVGGWQAGGWGGGEETTCMADCGRAAWLEADSERAWACRPTNAQGFISLLSSKKQNKV